MELTQVQKQAFYEQGFVQVSNVVPRHTINAALRAINHSIGQGMNIADMPSFRDRSFCPELQPDPIITDLLTQTPAWALAESLIGIGKIQPVNYGQIALRFPQRQDFSDPPSPHLDGMHTATNGVPEGIIKNFTLLVGIFLSDVPSPNSGNFTVWPGTHHLYEQYFREHDPRSLLQGMPNISLPEPQQIVGEAGDVILCHYQLAHAVAPNFSPHIRYAVFFRLFHVAKEAHKWESMTDIWLEWEGMRELVKTDRALSFRLRHQTKPRTHPENQTQP